MGSCGQKGWTRLSAHMHTVRKPKFREISPVHQRLGCQAELRFEAWVFGNELLSQHNMAGRGFSCQAHVVWDGRVVKSMVSGAGHPGTRVLPLTLCHHGQGDQTQLLPYNRDDSDETQL